MDAPACAERESFRSFRIGPDRSPGFARASGPDPGGGPLEPRQEFHAAQREQGRPTEFEPVPVGEPAAAPEGRPWKIAFVFRWQVLGRATAFVTALVPAAQVPASPAFAWRWLGFFAGPWGWWPRLRLENDFPGA